MDDVHTDGSPDAAPNPDRARRPRLAVVKFASCDGCQLTLLDCEDELLPLADQMDTVFFLEESSAPEPGPYDLALVEGSVTTAEDAARIRRIRAASRRLVTIGACATAGGVQALRNFADVADFREIVYARPEYIETMPAMIPLLRSEGMSDDDIGRILHTYNVTQFAELERDARHRETDRPRHARRPPGADRP